MKVDYIPIDSKKPLVVLLPNGETVVIEDGGVTVDTEFKWGLTVCLTSGLNIQSAPTMTLTFSAECSDYILIPKGGYKRYKEKLRRKKLKKEGHL